MATLSSSAWVALNSMRFMGIVPRRNDAAGNGMKRRTADPQRIAARHYAARLDEDGDAFRICGGRTRAERRCKESSGMIASDGAGAVALIGLRSSSRELAVMSCGCRDGYEYQ